jgi:hypothetical protein
MSQKGVEGLLGRMVTDGDFRRRFYQEPAATCIAQALEVTTRELEAVLALDEARVAEFSKMLDARIVRAQVNGASHCGATPEHVIGSRTDDVSQPAVRARQYRAR